MEMIKTRTTVNRTMVVRDPERDERIRNLTRGGMATAEVAHEMGLTFQQVRYVLVRDGLWAEPKHRDRVAHLALSGHAAAEIVERTGLTLRQVRAALWLASDE